MYKSITNLALFFVVSGLLVFQGCGGNALGTVQVSGTVTLDGEPAEGVTVAFVPNGEGREAYGMTNAQGRFVLTVPGTEAGSGAVPGEYSVTFTKYNDPTAGMSDAEIMALRHLPTPVSLLPPKYGDRNATDIAPVKVEQRGKNNFSFALVTS